MTIRWIESLVLCLLLIAFGANAAAQQIETSEGDRLDLSEDREPLDHPVRSSSDAEELRNAASEIVRRTNEFRAKHNLSELQTNSRLRATADDFARYMARTNRYGHQADDQRPAERVKNHDYEYCQVAENIGYYYNSQGVSATELAEQFMTGWIESEGHRENLLQESVSEIGVAVAQDEKTNYYFAVQLFALPRSAAVEFKVSNRSGEEVEYTVTRDARQRSFTLPPRAVMTHLRCLPPEVRLQGEDSQPSRPGAGAHLVITRQGGQLSLKMRDDEAAGAAP